MYTGKVFASYDDKVVTLVTAHWTNHDGVELVRIGNGKVIERSEFDVVFVCVS